MVPGDSDCGDCLSLRRGLGVSLSLGGVLQQVVRAPRLHSGNPESAEEVKEQVSAECPLRRLVQSMWRLSP